MRICGKSLIKGQPVGQLFVADENGEPAASAEFNVTWAVAVYPLPVGRSDL
jgi:hypothetical protein